MQYFGGKSRIAKPLATFLNRQLEKGQTFVDLFCGSCNVISQICPNRLRIANDIHYELIELHKAMQLGIILPEIVSEEDYKRIKLGDGESWLKGFVGFGCSYSGKWWGGYARGEISRNYALNAKNSLLKKHENLVNVVFCNQSYENVSLPKNSLIYCDIPYQGTTQYTTGNFEHYKFYGWAEEMKQEGHTVLVSEYMKNAVKGWEIVWEFQSKKDIRNRENLQEVTLEILMEPGNSLKEDRKNTVAGEL